jgi:hypothetical protein
MKKILILLTLLCAGYAMPSLAQACTSIDSVPYTVSAPGNYCLTAPQAVNMTSGNAISITANDVVLDCQDFSINNAATSRNSSSVGIHVLNKNTVTIKNCRVLGGFHTGIRAQQNNSVATQVYYLTLLDNYIAGPFVYGIWAYGSAIDIRDNRILDIGGRPASLAAGIRLGGSSVGGKFHVVKDNLIAGTNSPDNNAYGILSDNSQAAIIVNNGISGTAAVTGAYASYGVRLLGGTYNRITDNHVVGGGLTNDFGIVALDSTTSCFDNYIRSQQATSGCNATLGNF